MKPRVIVIGAGAAGLIAAGRAAECGAQVLVLEKMEEAGKKILISGQQRCNITNSAPLETFLQNYYPDGRFLRNAFARFFREALLDLLARYGVKTQTERGGRIFPASGHAEDVRDALVRYATTQGATLRYHSPVADLLVDAGRISGVHLHNGETIPADAVILTTGGASWTGTGSTGDGYRMAADVGHTIVPLRPSLVPLRTAEKAHAQALQGVSLRKVRCRLLTRDASGREVPLPPPYPLPDTGEMLFTHFGVSGPLVLSLSLAAVDALRAGREVWLSIDLKPGMSLDEVRARLQREFEASPHKHLPALLANWGPRRVGEVLTAWSGIGDAREVHTLRATERDALAALIKDWRWRITGSLPLEAGMVTAGGVALKEVEPRTLASRLVPGLYLAGEVLDIAADTGGFNLQAAFSTGYVAGESAATRAGSPSRDE